jgi:superfamily II DNA helicase RecQ
MGRLRRWAGAGRGGANGCAGLLRTRYQVEQLTETLNGRGYRAEALHGGMDQAQRDRAMGRLRSGVADLLVATDLAARGLDFQQLTHVINYDVPCASDAYVHRIGRAGRAGREASPSPSPSRGNTGCSRDPAGDQPTDGCRETAHHRRPARPAAGAETGGVAGKPAG